MPERFQEKFAGALQYYIAGYVTEGVVDGLEVVDINDQHAECRLVAFRSSGGPARRERRTPADC
jgi:hypothetical protein